MSREVEVPTSGQVTDKQFLQWLHDRLVVVHGERQSMDYMHRLRAIIHTAPDTRSPTLAGPEYRWYWTPIEGEADANS